MLFQSAGFIFVFLPLTLVFYYCIKSKYGIHPSLLLLCLSSVIFYSVYNPNHVAVIIVSILFNYWVASKISERNSSTFLFIGVSFNLLLLGWFKYFLLLSETVNSVLYLELELPDIILPIAISFFTFQQISYLVDLYRKEAKLYPFLQYFTFVTFFPQLIAGPIIHHKEIFPQLNERYLNRNKIGANLAIGGTLFCLGLIKKLGIADSVAPFADDLFNMSGVGYTPPLLDAWLGVGAYSLQIYFDFSGYSDMALGLARMFGIRLPLNFYSPYRATNIVDFWRCWHITLSRFLRKYLYFPLGGNRHGIFRRYANLFLVMILGGLWHGADWTFALWGGLHGLYLSLYHSWRYVIPSTWQSPGLSRVSWALTLVFVIIAWVPFRADDIETVMSVYSGMFGFEGFRIGENKLILLGKQNYMYGNLGLILANLGLSIDPSGSMTLTSHAWLTVAALIAFFCPNSYQILRRYKPALNLGEFLKNDRFTSFQIKLVWPVGLLLALCAALSFLKQSTTIEFLYFQF
ncbi:MBOAT family O-acyltransferase [Gimesia sp.]|uniref:MBOAT family O-acyltransferase n=1 Tax=Gimesia sp. TaxID=2024833 RepID=UPI003A921589